MIIIEYSLALHDEGCQARAQAYWRFQSATQEEQGWRTHQDSLLKIFPRFLRTLYFICSHDSIANGALVIARLQLATGSRPVDRNAHYGRPAQGKPD